VEPPDACLGRMEANWKLVEGHWGTGDGPLEPYRRLAEAF